MIGPFGLHPNKTMQSRALGLARPLVQQGHDVAMFMPPWHTPAEANKRWIEDGVHLRYSSLGGGPLGITRTLVREALAWRPEIVYCFKPKAYSGLAAAWLWQTSRRQVRLLMDTDDWEGWGGWNDKNPYTPLQKRFFAWQERWGMTHCHRLTVASRALESIAWSMGIPADKVSYLPNGSGVPNLLPLQSERWQAARKARRAALTVDEQRPFLFLYSRLFEFDTARLVEILARVKTAVPHLHILSIGTGLFAAESAAYRAQLAERGLLDAVHDAGWVDINKLPDWLAAADVGIYLMEDTLLNRTKCPVKLADMIAAGLPVVGEAVGQVNEYVVHGRSGFLHPSGDIDHVAGSLIRLLQDEALRRQMGLAAQQHAQTFAWERLAQRAISGL